MTKIRNNNFFYFIFSYIFVSFWFNTGKILATAEEGILFFNLNLSSNVFSNIWQSDGFGYVNPAVISQYLTLKLLSFFSPYFSNSQIQKYLYIFLVYIGLSFSYKLIKLITKDNLASFIGSLFYLLNVFVMSQIFARSLLIGVFAWSYFTLFLYMVIIITKKFSILYYLFFITSNILFSFSYGLPTNIILFWGTSVVFFVITFIQNRNFLLVRNFLLLLFIWTIINFWWLYPYVVLSPEAFTYALDKSKSLESLLAVSGFYPLKSILFLKNNFYFDPSLNKSLSWGSFFQNKFVIFISILEFLVFIFGMIKSFKNKRYLVIFVLGLLSLLIIKGTNPPFGKEFYTFGFKYLFFFSILRNPFEKLGLIFVLVYTVFFSVGLARIIRITGSKLLHSLIYFMIFGIVMVLPYWNKTIFPDNAWVDVPDYYEQMSKYIVTHADPGRVLVLPMIPDHGLKYSWGYAGDEPSRFIFNKSLISRLPKVPIFYNEYQYVKNELESSEYNKIENTLNKAGISYVLVNNDIDKKYKLNSNLSKITDLEIDYGNLHLFRLKNESEILNLESKAALVYKEINNQRYEVFIDESDQAEKLLFKTTYNKRWTAYINGKKINNHYMVYGYANAWDIPANTEKIDIVFKVWPWE